MAKLVATNIAVVINGVDLSDHVVSAEFSAGVDEVEDTAFGDRGAPFMLSIDGQTYDPDSYDAVREWVRDTFTAAQEVREIDGLPVHEDDVDFRVRHTDGLDGVFY